MGRYDDIISLPHHVSKKHRPMSLLNRAAQFSPYAALTGYEERVKEAARLTDHEIELDENMMNYLDLKLQKVLERIGEQPRISLTYFKPDERKTGGSYEQITGKLKKIDSAERKIIFSDGTEILYDRILSLDEI